jgi:hypothetical protein
MKRISLNVDDQTAAIISSGVEDGVSMTAMIKRSASLYKFLMDLSESGQKILIEDQQGKVREVILIK